LLCPSGLLFGGLKRCCYMQKKEYKSLLIHSIEINIFLLELKKSLLNLEIETEDPESDKRS
jgi:hypothetical protein